MRTVMVEITQADIDGGVRSGCYDCPVALAISRATGEEAHVYGGDVRLDGDDNRVFDLPREAVLWYRAYDSGETVAPFSFEFSCAD